jgi:hypothetical protein
MSYRVHIAWAGFELTTLVVIGTDCICRYKSNYHMITTTTAFETMLGMYRSRKWRQRQANKKSLAKSSVTFLIAVSWPRYSWNIVESGVKKTPLTDQNTILLHRISQWCKLYIRFVLLHKFLLSRTSHSICIISSIILHVG